MVWLTGIQYSAAVYAGYGILRNREWENIRSQRTKRKASGS
jgi:hypothetical protein